MMWRRSVCGPGVLLGAYGVNLTADQVQRLELPGPDGPAGLLLCLDLDLQPWTRAGDPSTVLALVSGFEEDPVDVARRLPFVREGWPHQWSIPTNGMIPDRLDRLLVPA